MRRVALALLLFAPGAFAQQPPRIDRLTPAQGPIAGGTAIAIEGANFAGATVRLDRQPVAPLSQSDSEVRLQMPPHDNGYVVVSIENASGAAYGEFLYVPPRLRDLPPGSITTVAGVGNYVRTFGPANRAYVMPVCIAFDSSANLYMTEAGQHRVTRVDSGGNIHEFAGGNLPQGQPPDYVPALDGGVSFPWGVAVGPGGNVYIGTHSPILRMVDVRTGVIVNAAGNNTPGFSGDGGPARDALTGQVTAVAADDFAQNRLETLAGIHPAYQDENGPAVAAPIMDDNMDLAIGRDGNLLIGDFRLRRLDADGNLQTIAGGHPDYSIFDNVPADKMYDACLAMDVAADGAIDFANTGDIRRLDAAGIYRRLGPKDANCAYDGDGGAFQEAHLCQPWDTARDAAGNLYIADTNNNRIRRVDAKSGIITTFAGGGGPVSGIEGYGRGTYCGDGGPAAAACLNTPYGLAVDADGTVFVSENWQRIRRIAPNGTIETFAGSLGGISKIVFGPGRYLYGTAIERAGRFDRSGSFQALAGSGQRGFSGDGGPALQASMNSGGQAAGVAVDAEGNFYFQDAANRRVRAVRYGAVLAPPNATIAATATGPAIRAVVRDASGRPAPSVRVDFTTPASGASCILSSGFAITDADGVASVSCTPNCVTGTYDVIAQPLTSSSTARVSFTNPAISCRHRSVRH